MIEEKMGKAFKNLIENQMWICLSTINSSGIPETRAMINLAHSKMFPALQKFFCDGFTAYFSTNTSSEKIQQLGLNNKSSVYYYNFETFEGLLLSGEMETVTTKKMKEDFWQDNWIRFYKKGVTDPDYTLLQFNPCSYRFYNGKGEVASGIL